MNRVTNQLRTYQIEGVIRLIELSGARHTAILADEPGLGKTIQVAESINWPRPHEVLIVCPASLRWPLVTKENLAAYKLLF